MPSFGPHEISYSEFKAAVAEGRVEEVSISAEVIRGRMRPAGVPGDTPPTGKAILFSTVRVDDPDLLRDIEAHHVRVTAIIESTFFRDLLSWVVPLVLFFGLWWLLIRRIQGQGGFMTIGRSKAKIYMEKDVKVRFTEVAGVEEAKKSFWRLSSSSRCLRSSAG